MIKVEHIQASICGVTGSRIDTLVCEYPYIIHAQLLTHGVFSKCSSSARAVPIKKSIEQLRANPAEYFWTLNESGMQGSEVTDVHTLAKSNRILHMAMESMIGFAELLGYPEDDGGLGIHKQNASRLLIPFQNIRIVLTSTEWENWDWLRIDSAAQGEIAELARMIKQARDEAEPMVLKPGELHVPFVDRERHWETEELNYFIEQDMEQIAITVEEALRISASVSAQTSYRQADFTLEKANKIEGMLINGKKVHASPFEHQAIGLPYGNLDSDDFLTMLFNLPEGVTHVDRKGNLWSGNFKGFIQHRQLIKGHDYALRDK